MDPREGLGCFVDEDGTYSLLAPPRRGPQAGKSGDPRSENADRYGHLALDPARKKNNPMKKTNGRSRTDPHKRDVTGTNKKKQHRKEANNMVNNNHINMA